MKFDSEIVVEVASEYFHFTKGNQQLRLATYLNIKSENGKTFPIAIGERQEIFGSTLVSVFDPNISDNPDTDKMALLQMLMEYGVGKLLEQQRFPSLRPRIVFRGHENLRTILCGYQRGILETAAMRGGAREVRFE
jgi:hypothetical protein